MATIAENLIALQEAKENIKTAIEGKGVSLEGIPLTKWGNTLAEASIGGGGSGGDDTETVKGLVDGTLTEFDNTKVKATSLIPYRFYEFSNLTKVNLKGITVIPESLCYYCTGLTELILDNNTTQIHDKAFMNCKAVANLVIPSTITSIGEYAFNGVSDITTSTATKFNLHLDNVCDIGTYAFGSSKLENISGKLGNIAANGLRTSWTLTKSVDVSIFGSIGEYAFAYLVGLDNLTIRADSNVTGTIGSYAFSEVGASRATPSTKIFSLDFSNSSFTTINQYAFGGTSAADKVQYCTIKFPETLTTINTDAFRYSNNLNLYFSGNPANLNSYAFRSATNLKLFVPYNLLEIYKTATNWAAQANNMRGYAKANTFTQGQTLPIYSTEGYGLTWYSDESMLNKVTLVDNPDAIYYCSISSTKTAAVITKFVEDNCIAQLVDTNNNVYTMGDYVPVGTTLTLSVSANEGYIPYLLSINGTNVSSSTYTVGTEDLEVVAICYDGVTIPAVPGLANNSWATIKRIVQEGRAHLYWTVGEEKNTTIDGTTYAVRLADLQQGRYTYADGVRSTNAAFEIYTLYSTSQAMNPLELTNKGGFGAMSLSTHINTTIVSKFATDLASLLEEVNIPYADGGSSNYTGIISSAHKLFFQTPREINVTSTSYSRVGEGTVWDYYVNATSANIKKKTSAGSTQIWWTRSPYPGGSNNFTVINTSGSGQGYSVYSNVYMSFCFAW